MFEPWLTRTLELERRSHVPQRNRMSYSVRHFAKPDCTSIFACDRRLLVGSGPSALATFPSEIACLIDVVVVRGQPSVENAWFLHHEVVLRVVEGDGPAIEEALMAQYPSERHPPIADKEPDVSLPTEFFERRQRQPYVFELSHVLASADGVLRSPRVVVPVNAKGVANALRKERERCTGVDENGHGDRKVLTLEANINRRAENGNLKVRILEHILLPIWEELKLGLIAQRRI